MGIPSLAWDSSDYAGQRYGTLTYASTVYIYWHDNNLADIWIRRSHTPTYDLWHLYNLAGIPRTGTPRHQANAPAASASLDWKHPVRQGDALTAPAISVGTLNDGILTINGNMYATDVNGQNIRLIIENDDYSWRGRLNPEAGAGIVKTDASGNVSKINGSNTQVVLGNGTLAVAPNTIGSIIEVRADLTISPTTDTINLAIYVNSVITINWSSLTYGSLFKVLYSYQSGVRRSVTLNFNRGGSNFPGSEVVLGSNGMELFVLDAYITRVNSAILNMMNLGLKSLTLTPAAGVTNYKSPNVYYNEYARTVTFLLDITLTVAKNSGDTIFGSNGNMPKPPQEIYFAATMYNGTSRSFRINASGIVNFMGDPAPPGDYRGSVTYIY